MSMMFSAVAGDGCPNQCTGAQTENCLRPSGHLEITGVGKGVTIDSDYSGNDYRLVVFSSAFSGCTSLTSVTMPKVSTIDKDAFFGCTSLKTVSMPKVTEIDMRAFAGCTSLTWVHMPKVHTIGMDAFGGTPYSTTPWLDKTALKVQYSSLGC